MSKSLMIVVCDFSQLDTCPKVECLGHIGHIPTLSHLDTTGVFDSPVNDGLVPIK